jgi:hypothetical protein
MDISGRENVTKEMELWDSCLKGISFDWTAFSLVISIKWLAKELCGFYRPHTLWSLIELLFPGSTVSDLSSKFEYSA